MPDAASPPHSRCWRSWWGSSLAGGAVRTRIGVDLSPDSVRAYVLGLGLTAQVVFVGLVIFRSFLLLPSMVLLTAGGLAFGATLGTLLGGAGILLSGMMTFGIARVVGREWIRPRLGETFRRLERRLERTGPLLIGLATAHPMGPMSPFHWAAGLSSIPWLPFLAAIGVAGCLAAPPPRRDLGQHVDLDRLVLLAVVDQLDLGQHLVGERGRHHEARVAGGAAQVEQAPLGEDQHAVAVGEDPLVVLGLDVRLA